MGALLMVLFSVGIGLVSSLALAWLMLPTRFVKHPPVSKGDVSVQVLVLGDIGRSPRMQYHALSIAQHGGRADIIGYAESPLLPELMRNPRVNVYPLRQPPSVLQYEQVPFLVRGPLKVLWQYLLLFKTLGYEAPPARWLLVQNPPAIPTLAIALAISVLRNTHLLVDWHNYGWSVLANTRGARHPFVRISKWYECRLGRSAPTANLTVTDAMSRQLKEPPYSIKSPIMTLHDRPAAIFQPVESTAARQAFLERLPHTADSASSIMDGTTRLIVSSTSWTPDEDFSLLLDALVEYAKPRSDVEAVPILAIITGRGPQKDMYEDRVRKLQQEGSLPGVRIVTAWLSMVDYASLLSAADLGICLHKSTSGVDLPMKVVDMFGAGLPVAAYSGYESFSELVREGDNGCGFETADELAVVLKRLLSTAEGEAELKQLRNGAVKEGSRRWDAEWDRVVGKFLGVFDDKPH